MIEGRKYRLNVKSERQNMIVLHDSALLCDILKQYNEGESIHIYFNHMFN